MTGPKNQPPDDLTAAHAFVESLVPRADGHSAGTYPWWHGWAVREAYLAGVLAERERAARVADGLVWTEGGWPGLHREGMSDAAERIAKLIRSGGRPGA